MGIAVIIIKRNTETFNKALKQLKTQQQTRWRYITYDHRQVYFTDGAVLPTDKGNMSGPLDSEMHNFTEIVTKVADVMLSTNQHNHGLADQYNRCSSDLFIMEDLLRNTIAVDHRQTPEILVIADNGHLHQNTEQIKVQPQQWSL